MKTIGLLGGMSWESSADYYRAINEGIRESLGGLHSAKVALYSVDFEPLEKLQHSDDWEGVAKILVDAACKVESAGADLLLICTNTMHKVADEIEQAIDIPLLHIADATAFALRDKGIRKVGLLGTAFTMEQGFYKGRLSDGFGIDTIVPNNKDRELIHQVIYQELCLGKVLEKSKSAYLRIISELESEGAEAVILGCTEIGMLVSQADTDVMLFDTTVLHARKAVQIALMQE